MVLSHEDKSVNPHQYWYARVIGIFHADVRLNTGNGTATKSRRLEVLWVRWFGLDVLHDGDWESRRLPRVRFIEHNEEEGGTFGFLDPTVVIRGVHLIPVFAHGKTTELLAPSVARQPMEKDEDWKYYYVNM